MERWGFLTKEEYTDLAIGTWRRFFLESQIISTI